MHFGPQIQNIIFKEISKLYEAVFRTSPSLPKMIRIFFFHIMPYKVLIIF